MDTYRTHLCGSSAADNPGNLEKYVLSSSAGLGVELFNSSINRTTATTIAVPFRRRFIIGPSFLVAANVCCVVLWGA